MTGAGGMFRCKDLTELVTDFVDGQLPLAQRIQIYLHLGSCRHCRAYVAQTKTTMKLLGQLPAEPVSASMRDELLTLVRQRRLASRFITIP